MLIDLNSIKLFEIEEKVLDKEEVKGIIFSESLLISCFHFKTIKDPVQVKIKRNDDSLETINEHLLISEADAESKEDKKNNTNKQNDNFHYFFFGQNMNEDIILIDGFPILVPNKCGEKCCCRAMVCFCNQLDLDNDYSQEKINNSDSYTKYSESKNKLTINDDIEDSLSANKYFLAQNNSIKIEEDEVPLTFHNYNESDMSTNLLLREDYFNDLTNDIDNEVTKKNESEENNFLMKKLSISHSTPVGGTSISVQNIGQNNDKLIIYSSSKYHKNRVNTSSDFVSIIRLDLSTIEENKIRLMKDEDVLKKDQCYITSDINMGYDLKITKKDGVTKTTDSEYINVDIAKDYILEGANIVLLRYLAITKYEGKFKTKSISVNGECCDNIYVCNIIQGSFVENQKIPLVKVTRHVIDSNSYMTKSISYLTLTGSLVRHECSNSNYVVHLNPLIAINLETNEIIRHVPLRKNWKKDMELFSKYMDFKNNRLVENESYFSHHTRLRVLLSDYLRTILMMKPEEVLPFTRCFFGKFTQRVDLPYNSYFEKMSTLRK